MIKKLCIEFNEEITELLDNISLNEQSTKKETIRRALGLYSFLSRENKKVVSY